MRLYAARGDRGALARTYQTCASVLKRELAIEPGLTTRTTYQRLMHAEDESRISQETFHETFLKRSLHYTANW